MKKIIALLLCACMLWGIFSTAVSAVEYIEDETFVIGNADGDEDGKVNLKDIFAMKLYLMQMSGENAAFDDQAADLNSDGKVTMTDLFMMKTYMLNLISASDIETGYQTNKFTIGGVDISDFSIVVVGENSARENACYTAELLQKYIAVATGVTLNIVDSVEEEDHAIKINAIDRFGELGDIYGNENYKYEVKDGDLELYGTYRGNMYAAFEILEEYLGYRFFDDEYVFIYKQRCADIPADTSVFFEPYLTFRCAGNNVDTSMENYYLPSRMNGSRNDCGTASYRYGTFCGHQFCNAHSYGLYWRMATGTFPDESFGTLAERYNYQYETGEQKNEQNWQPCATKEEEYRTLFKGMIDTIARMESWEGYDFFYEFKDENGEMTEYVKSGQPSISFSPCDNGSWCTCRKCYSKVSGKMEGYGKEGYSGLYIDLANRGVRDLQDYYPGMRVHTILYAKEIPETVRPDKNLNIYYCGFACNNHWLGSGGCGDGHGQYNTENNSDSEASLIAWGEMCREAGAQMWFWYYGVTCAFYLVSLPCVFNIYYDYKFLYEQAHITGAYYEGTECEYNFENLKAYMASKMEWDPTMSYDEYIAYMKEYLYMYYGDGYEKVYEFIDMENTAGDECGTCFTSNFDRPGDMFSYAYIAEHYEYMRELLLDAIEMAKRDEQRQRVETLLACFDFLGLSSSYDEMYTNGTPESIALYEERYTDMYNYLKDNNIKIYVEPSAASLPETIDFTVNPMIQFYYYGSRRPGVTP